MFNVTSLVNITVSLRMRRMTEMNFPLQRNPMIQIPQLTFEIFQIFHRGDCVQVNS